MKPTRKTLYLAEAAQKLFKDSPLSSSGRINQVSDRYLMICKLHGLDFNDAEKTVLVKSLGNRKKITALMLKNIDSVLDNSDYAGTPVAKSIIHKLGNASFADLCAELERIDL